MTVRALFFVLIAAFVSIGSAFAEETINRYDVVIDVQKNADILVSETIDVMAEGREIRRGIFRDLPRTFEKDGIVLAYGYDVLSVTRDGMKEPYVREDVGNAMRIRIGSEDVFLDAGRHVYEIKYRVKNQIGYFDGYDELYWNVTGTYWAFPILAAKAEVRLPEGARVLQTRAYTGRMGADGADYSYAQRGDAHIFETTRALEPREGLTVAVGFAKGVVAPPSAGDRTALWWARNGALTILTGSIGGLFWFLFRSWSRVGRDPPRLPVFPRYEAPEGISPAAAHHILNRSLSGNDALIATLMNLAVKGRLKIDASNKSATTLTQLEASASAPDISSEDAALAASLFSRGNSKTLGSKYDAGFTKAYMKFRASLSEKYGNPYFKWNALYTVGAAVLTAIAIGFAATQTLNWNMWHTGGVLALAALNGMFMYLMPAPTPKGAEVRSAVQGFRLYMDTAEKLQMNAVEVGSEAPPPMSKERYEAFLPYAVALGVEKPWTKYFEKMLPDVAREYNPGWTYLGSHRSIGDMNKSIIGSLSSGVEASLPKSSGSSGSGGGGSSGGGGGGGGGGGW